MSRAFGNRLLKQFVVAEPEIQVCGGLKPIQFVTIWYQLCLIQKLKLYENLSVVLQARISQVLSKLIY